MRRATCCDEGKLRIRNGGKCRKRIELRCAVGFCVASREIREMREKGFKQGACVETVDWRAVGKETVDRRVGFLVMVAGAGLRAHRGGWAHAKPTVRITKLMKGNAEGISPRKVTPRMNRNRCNRRMPTPSSATGIPKKNAGYSRGYRFSQSASFSSHSCKTETLVSSRSASSRRSREPSPNFTSGGWSLFFMCGMWSRHLLNRFRRAARGWH